MNPLLHRYQRYTGRSLEVRNVQHDATDEICYDEEKKWQKFEEVVASVQRMFAPNSKVTHNDKVRGKISKKLRQIDISIRQNVGQYRLMIAIDCKDHKDPVDIGIVEEFKSKLKDIGANKGAIISASGFTDGAKKIAKNAGIDIYRLVDTEKHDWQAYVTIPVLCDFRSIKRTQFIFKSSIRGPCVIPSIDPKALILYRENGSLIDSVFNLLIKKWNKGLLPKEPGVHENLKLNDTPTCIKVEGRFYHLDSFVNIKVEKNLYFGQLPIEEIKGFQDQQTGGVIAKGFTTGTLDVREVEKKWQRIKSEEDLAVQPLLVFRAIDSYPVLEVQLPNEQEEKQSK